MTEIRIEKANGDPSPFQEDVHIGNFYPGGQRAEVLGKIIAAAYDDVPIITLTGAEGSGKTMLCRMLEQELAPDYVVIVFARTVESFEDVVRKIALRLGIEADSQPDRKTTERYLVKIIEFLLQSNRRVLIVFDEAENLYLATLERVRKMLDRITEGGARLQLMFAGKKTFLENSEQLSICDFINNQEVHFSLSALEDDEALEYLQHGLDSIVADEQLKSRIAACIPAIIETAGGNFGRLNMLLRQALDSGGDDSSFMVLLDNVKEEIESEPSSLPFSAIQGVRPLQNIRRYLPIVVGGFLLILAGLWFFPSGDDSSGGDAENVVSPQDEPTVSLPVESLTAPEQNAGTVGTETTVKQDDNQGDMPASSVVSSPASTQPAETTPEKAPVAADSQKMQTTANAEVVDNAEKKDSPDKSDATNEGPVEEEVVGTEDAGSQGPSAQKQQEQPVDIVILSAPEALKRKPENGEQQTEEDANAKQRNEVEEVIAANAHFTVEQLYQKRIQAGVDWKLGERNDMYTVQLMVLTSKNSEENLKKMLATDEFRQEAGNFFVFKKRSTPDVIFIFYGEYPTMSFARLATNSLPPFLQKYKPYAISIKGAMAKVNR